MSLKDDVEYALKEADSVAKGLPCDLCTEKWEWAVSSNSGKTVKVCASCGEVLFSALAERLQGRNAVKIIAREKN